MSKDGGRKVRKGIGFVVGVMKCFKIISVIVAHICGYTKNHQTNYFQYVNFMIYELHFNDFIIKKLEEVEVYTVVSFFEVYAVISFFI